MLRRNRVFGLNLFAGLVVENQSQRMEKRMERKIVSREKKIVR